MQLKKYNIKSESEITDWDEGLPLGNGMIGALIYGKAPLKIAVDRADLWDSRVAPFMKSKDFNWDTLVKLSMGSEDDWNRRNALFERSTDYPYPTKLSAGRFELSPKEAAKTIHYELDIEKAISHIDINGNRFADGFVSASFEVGAFRFYNGFDIKFHIPEYISSDGKDCLGYKKAEILSENGKTFIIQKTHTDFSYCIAYAVCEKVDCRELYFTVVTGVGDDCISKADSTLCKAISAGFGKIEKVHTAQWKKYWGMSCLRVPDELIEKTYYRSQYLFACCSAANGVPMALQGVWTADNDKLPPWRGDYHFDTNVELSYQSYLKANRIENGRVIVDYLWNHKDNYKRFARDFYGTNGLIIPSGSTLGGDPMGGWAQYYLSPTMTIWAAQSFDEYYLYTGDEEFLKNRAYPFFSDIAVAISGLLKEKNGKLYLPLSSSPEVYANTKKAYLKPNSNFDLALLIYLFGTLKGYCEKLSKSDEAEKCGEILSKLDEIAIDEKRGVMLDSTQCLEETHRHFSHLMCLYPLHLINYDTDAHKLLYEHTINEIEKLGMGLWVGFSFGMAAQIYAMAKQGNAAHEKLLQFCKGFVAKNGFHLNGDFNRYGYTLFHYRPFTLESSFCFCDALHEMLLQDHQGYIDLFPAVPNDWKMGELSFEKLRSRGGILVSSKMKNGQITELTIDAPRSCKVCVNGVEYELHNGVNGII